MDLQNAEMCCTINDGRLVCDGFADSGRDDGHHGTAE